MSVSRKPSNGPADVQLRAARRRMPAEAHPPPVEEAQGELPCKRAGCRCHSLNGHQERWKEFPAVG